MGRKKMYAASIMSMRDMGEYRNLLSQINKSCHQANTTFRDFLKFASLNALDSTNPTTLGYYCSALYAHGLDPGTISTRIDHIKSERTRLSAGGVTIYLIQRYFDLLKAKKGRRPKSDAPWKTLITELTRAPRCLERTACVLMILTGSRNGCLGGLGDFRVSTNMLSCDVLISKQRRSISDFGLLKLYKPFNIWEELTPELQTDIQNWAGSRNAQGQRKVVGSSQLIQWMQKNINRKYTTNTYRRSYIHMILDGCTDANGRVDYARVITMTMHFRESTIRAFYEKRTADLEFSDGDDE